MRSPATRQGHRGRRPGAATVRASRPVTVSTGEARRAGAAGEGRCWASRGHGVTDTRPSRVTGVGDPTSTGQLVRKALGSVEVAVRLPGTSPHRAELPPAPAPPWRTCATAEREHAPASRRECPAPRALPADRARALRDGPPLGLHQARPRPRAARHRRARDPVIDYLMPAQGGVTFPKGVAHPLGEPT